MHPTIAYELIEARTADRQRQADQTALAQAARRASRGETSPGRHPAAGLARRVLTVLAARTVLATRRLPAPTRPRPIAACQPLAPCTTCA
jgi:hypothetical protein